MEATTPSRRPKAKSKPTSEPAPSLPSSSMSPSSELLKTVQSLQDEIAVLRSSSEATTLESQAELLRLKDDLAEAKRELTAVKVVPAAGQKKTLTNFGFFTCEES